MLVKCSFCCKRYERAGAYEIHLRSAHANLDIVLASTIRNPPTDVLTDRGTDLSDANEPIKHSDSDYESDPAGDTAGSERDAPDDTLRREPETEVLEDNTYPVAAEQEEYPGAGEAIGEVKEYKEGCRDLCENPWAPFASAQGFKLASWFIERKVSKTQINDYFRMVSETRHPSAIALCIRWRIFSDTWIRIARICNCWRDMWRTVREHYHSSIGTS